MRRTRFCTLMAVLLVAMPPAGAGGASRGAALATSERCPGTGSLVIHVRQVGTKVPIPLATVGTDRHEGGIADSSGVVRLRCVLPGMVRIRAYLRGYESKPESALVRPGETVTVILALRRIKGRLPKEGTIPIPPPAPVRF